MSDDAMTQLRERVAAHGARIESVEHRLDYICRRLESTETKEDAQRREDRLHSDLQELSTKLDKTLNGFRSSITELLREQSEASGKALWSDKILWALAGGILAAAVAAIMRSVM